MGTKQLYNDNLRKLPNEYGDVSVTLYTGQSVVYLSFGCFSPNGIFELFTTSMGLSFTWRCPVAPYMIPSNTATQFAVFRESLRIGLLRSCICIFIAVI